MSSIRELRDQVASARDGRTLRLLLVDIFSELRRTAPSEVGSSFDENMEILLRGFFARDVRQAISDILENLATGYPPVEDNVSDLADLVKNDLYGPSIRSHVTQAIDLMTGGFVRITKSGSNVTYSPDVSYVLVGESLIMDVTPNAGYIWAGENPIVVHHGSSSVTPVEYEDRYTISIPQVQHDISIETNVIPDQTMYNVTITGEGHTHATYTDMRTQVPEGESYTQIITVDDGYTSNGPIVRMDDTDITEETVKKIGTNMWQCEIASVTGDIDMLVEIFRESTRHETIEFTPTEYIPSYTNPVYTPLEVSFSTISGYDLKYITIETADSTQLFIKSIKKMALKKVNGAWVVDSVVTDGLATNNRYISVISTDSGFKTQLITDDDDAPNGTRINLGLGVNVRPAEFEPEKNNRAAQLEKAPYTIIGYTYIPMT